jgi:flagellar biosynthesis chaperone FliJ
LPYHKDKQQAFQAAQQGTQEAVDAYSQIVRESAGYGTQLQHLRQEINEAIQQIGNALEVSTDHQQAQLVQYLDDLQEIMNELNSEG